MTATDPMHQLAHAEAKAAVARIAARHAFDRDALDPEVVAECDRYGVQLIDHCATCHGELPAHEAWCGIGEAQALGDAADRAYENARGK